MHWIPDVPKIIEDQIERENLITQRALWEATPEIKTTITTSNIVGLAAAAATSHETNYTPANILESILINETTNRLEHRSLRRLARLNVLETKKKKMILITFKTTRRYSCGHEFKNTTSN